MLFLLLNIENERYALESQQVVEILPLVTLKPVPRTPKYIAGVFNYQGTIIPVIDLCYLIEEKSCCEHLSTRIIVVKYKGLTKTTTFHLIGLMAERIVETLHKSEAELVDSNIQIDTAPYLGKMIVDDQGMIQCIRLEYLLSKAEQVNLLAESKINEVTNNLCAGDDKTS